MVNSQLMSKIFSFLFLFFLLLSNIEAQTLPYETVTVEGKSFYKYRVQSGEGLYAISRTFSVSVADIIRGNPGSNQGLQNGQELLIPIAGNVPTTENVGSSSLLVPLSAATPTPNQGGPVDQNVNFKHTVVSGETVYSISKMYNTSVDDIYRLNPSSKEGIGVGEVLIIPQRRVISEVKEENYRYHTILPKETLYSVSKT